MHIFIAIARQMCMAQSCSDSSDLIACSMECTMATFS
jgi:hypothetical protein